MITTRLIRAAGVAALAALAGTATAGELSADQVARLDREVDVAQHHLLLVGRRESLDRQHGSPRTVVARHRGAAR